MKVGRYELGNRNDVPRMRDIRNTESRSVGLDLRRLEGGDIENP
jgi:hypothetical protein